jgi:polar amino acid transport system substrate-binding protein
MKKLLILLFIFAFALAGCGGTDGGVSDGGDNETAVEDTENESKLDAIKRAGVITMFTNAEFPPFEFMEGNEIIGVDVEIGKAIAERIGVELNIENAEFAGIVASIASGRGDMAITGLTITEERAQTVDFSVPYVNSIQYLILPEGSDILFMEALENKTVGVQTGTTGSMFVEDEIEDGVLDGKGTEVRHYNSAPIAMQDLIVGRLDAVIIDQHVAL